MENFAGSKLGGMERRFRMNQNNITVKQLVDLLNQNENLRSASGTDRILSLSVNGQFLGYITSAQLDGWGSGLITDVCLELNTEIRTNADNIRSMSIDELAQSRIDRIDMYLKSDSQMWIGDFKGIAETKKDALELEIEWLESECDKE